MSEVEGAVGGAVGLGADVALALVEGWVPGDAADGDSPSPDPQAAKAADTSMAAPRARVIAA